MLYDAYQAQTDLLMPARLAARAAQGWLAGGFPFGDNPLTRSWGATLELFARSGMSHERPPFGIGEVIVDGEPVAVSEQVVWHTPFCRLRRFVKDRAERGPRVLLVAPMSGHFATLLRGTVRTLLEHHDVYITDWVNARDVSLAYGRFDFDDFVDHVIDALHALGPDTHVVAVCQPSVPVLVAVALMNAANDPAAPRSMTLMGGPIDGRAAPTQVNRFAEGHTIGWFERNVVTSVPIRFPGAFRRVYPGFLQLAGFVSMNFDRHVNAHIDMFKNLVKGDGESADATRRFYDEYLAVMDLPAEFYLQTIRQVFQEYELPRGVLTSRGRPVEPASITQTALLTVEGEHDDICAVGQTGAAHALCTGLPERMHGRHVQPKVGHYGVFNGRRWQTEIYPVVRDFIAANG